MGSIKSNKQIENKPAMKMKTIKWSGVLAGLLLGVVTVSFGQVYGPGQANPNGYGYNQPYPNGNGYSQNYPNPNYPNGYNNGYGQSYPNGYGQAYPNTYGYDQYGYPIQPPVVVVPPRVIIAPPPVFVGPPVIIRPYVNYGYGRSGYGGVYRGGYGGGRGGYGGRGGHHW
ncbi:hypothetical protein GCM10028774_55330 [Spirosoma jeollabukense]